MFDTPRLSYGAALTLLARGDERMTRLDRALGGVLLAAAPFTGGSSLALIDPKTELMALLRHVTDIAPARIKVARGKQHLEMLEAAHTVLVLSAFFDAFRQEVGPGYDRLEVTDAERSALVQRADAPDLLGAPGIALPTVTSPFTENLGHIQARLELLADETLWFVSGLAAWTHVRPPGDDAELRRAVVERALGYYRDRYVRLGADLPEFAFWSDLDEHAATRRSVDAVGGALAAQTETLTELTRLLTTTVAGDGQASDVTAKLATQASAVLGERLWRETPGARFPLVADGFVSPRFRQAVATNDAMPSDEAWWATQDTHDGLAGYLARYLANPHAARHPLIVLGHPGAGKSLLSRIVAARLPSTAYTAILIRLRRADAEAEIYEQIEEALRAEVHERVDWGKFSRETATTKVVIFDGFDELIQTTGVVQSRYLERIAAFQAKEWHYGHSVIPIVTSRTLVMDRAKVPDGSVLIRLEDFDDDQVERWIGAWNRANAPTPGFRALTAAEALHHGDIARQPLLLTLLAVYAAQGGVESLAAEDLSGAELYRRLLDTFIARQVGDKVARDLDPADARRRATQLRGDLSLAAFAMFNRGQQFVSEDDLGHDLGALLPRSSEVTRTDAGQPVSRAEQALAAFFFIHVARSTDEATELRTYEFLHATFQEYLVAEFTVTLMHQLAADRARTADRIDAAPLDSPRLRELLSHQTLFVRAPIVAFARQRLAALGAEAADVREAAIDLFRRARDRAPNDGAAGYAPTRYDPVRRLACYTANLVTLAVLCGEPVPVAALAEPDEWTSTVRLWQAGLDAEGRSALFSKLVRTDAELVVPNYPEHVWGTSAEQRRVAQLTDDPTLDGVLAIGAELLGMPFITPTQLTRDVSRELAQLLRNRWPTPGLRRLVTYDEDVYRDLLATLEANVERLPTLSEHAVNVLVNCLIDDGPQLPPDLVLRFVRLLVGSGPPPDGAAGLLGGHRLPALALRCPYLWDDPLLAAELRLSIEYPTILPAFLLARSPERIPLEHRSEVLAALEQRFTHIGPGDFISGGVAVEMLDQFGGVLSESAAGELLAYLGHQPETAWPAVAPTALRRFLAGLPSGSTYQRLLDSVNAYLGHRGRNTDSTTLGAAIAVLDAYIAEREAQADASA
ncbi:hypothetical protein [Cryptosporangium aurantiacum]|uniref:NACHT N-terminal Helical domain-containing protein n=1 Tax=Cryptosporangium aurantiacum TaxID=134849 RepID=A0A1M7R8M1_9ACTN|nr:hypothetical protein [Cryptosporangium aurantiacum]SHN42490.1 hypothetical protein SAMN05443668_108226 [Cryptosporangium aurantiacum]